MAPAHLSSPRLYNPLVAWAPSNFSTAQYLRYLFTITKAMDTPDLSLETVARVARVGAPKEGFTVFSQLQSDVFIAVHLSIGLKS